MQKKPAARQILAVPRWRTQAARPEKPLAAAAAVAVVVRRAAAIVIAATVVETAGKQDQDDDPPPVVAATIIVTAAAAVVKAAGKQDQNDDPPPVVAAAITPITHFMFPPLYCCWPFGPRYDIVRVPAEMCACLAVCAVQAKASVFS